MWAALLATNRQKSTDILYTVNESSLATGAAVGSVNLPAKQPITDAQKVSGVDGTLPEWKRRMIEKNEAAKKEVTDIMDDSLRRVMAKTELKPDNQKGPAVDSYISAVDWIMWSVNSIIRRVK